MHAEAGASNARQSTADQQADVAQASAAVSSGALSDEEPALAQQTPAAKKKLEPDGVADGDEHPALQDHQVVDVSSEDAPKAKRSTRERASAGKNCVDTETQEGKAMSYRYRSPQLCVWKFKPSECVVQYIGIAVE